jgi:cobalt/nickel transport system permease protein
MNIQNVFANLGFLERLSFQDSLIHRLDPRAKLLTTLIFIITVVSFHKYEIANLFPLLLFPVAQLALANIPATYLFRQLLHIFPFVILIGILNPIWDNKVLFAWQGMEFTGGWISFLSIILRFFLTAGSALLLIATTGIMALGLGLERLYLPRIFAVQLIFIYRYIFVLVEETARMLRARSLRVFNGKGMNLGVAAVIIGSLLLRTIYRAQRIHQAMVSRGFDGQVRIMKKLHFTLVDFAYILFWSIYFFIIRFARVPHWLGSLVQV